MNRLPVVVLLMCAICTVAAGDSSTLFSLPPEESDPGETRGEREWTPVSSLFPPADELLADVQARLPRDSVQILGDLKVRRRKGTTIRSFNVDIHFDLGNSTPLARYAIRDTFGNDLEELTVVHPESVNPRLDYRKGNPLTPSELMGMFEPIQGTDISWTDLTLAFLRWRGGETVGRDTFKGQTCLLVDLPAPAEAGAGDLGRYAKVRIWVHEHLRMIVQAEAYNEEGDLVRRLEIKGLRKVDDRWMIKDMEVESFPPVHKTRFRVREVRGGLTYDDDSDS